MKKTKAIFMLSVLFGLIVFASIITLSLSADPGAFPKPGVDGKWEAVCCGTRCNGGNDYCVGTGNLVCCK